MDRRRFIEMLGLGAAGVAFNSAIIGPIWELPRDLVLTDGPVTHEWIAAEATKVLCENFEFPAKRSTQAMVPMDDVQHLGIHMRTDLEHPSIDSRHEFRPALYRACNAATCSRDDLLQSTTLSASGLAARRRTCALDYA